MGASDPRPLTVLDCTLRDGGYYNDWDFPLDLARRYIRAIAASGVEAVELGFRFTPRNRFLGPFAYTTDDFVETLELPDGPSWAVMCNASDLVGFAAGPAAATDLLFAPAEQSPISLVRIATHYRELERCAPAVARLAHLGYRVGVNLMQSAGRSADVLSAAAATVRSWGDVEVLYFGDSLGSMDGGMVRDTVEALAREWHGPLGIHAHDNQGRALSNTLSAIDAGASWIDGTVLGMGRGAGNLCIETLIFELAQRPGARWRCEPLIPLVLDDFRRLRERHGWGPGLLYHMSAAYGIHPTYIQEMLGEGRYDAAEVLSAFERLRESNASSYSASSLRSAFASTAAEPDGSWDASGFVAGRDVLLVGAGPSVAEHAAGLLRYVEKHAPFVLGLNVGRELPADLVSAYVACHPRRFLMEIDAYRTLDRPVVLPRSALPEWASKDLAGIDVLDYGLHVEPGRFEARARGCTTPFLLAVAYALGLAVAGGAERVLLAGFDGYDPADRRQAEMLVLLESYGASGAAIPLLSVTPTSYPVPQSSIYSPRL